MPSNAQPNPQREYVRSKLTAIIASLWASNPGEAAKERLAEEEVVSADPGDWAADVMVRIGGLNWVFW